MFAEDKSNIDKLILENDPDSMKYRSGHPYAYWTFLIPLIKKFDFFTVDLRGVYS